mmetsp:Transcript_20736/g.37390  ORF Transcript_20736/g.37390 Transcript_20736/m.37390 type:complete len:433 (+) Transcript_20736:104-1402(+)|eukprot:CAMPEP_0178753276 /NCGR_PEP_ID=MMETSP0744-20121128/11522_1 /TAXON_ID=913974 /ORGANISM="Nitzschia punctata, Strain CCMP561" /LENGTH=432 /DNA_ID=CAMNT_0020407075 /DNA_START=226 /DNA_END=1524 /DNA_ORIENTATION=-
MNRDIAVNSNTLPSISKTRSSYMWNPLSAQQNPSRKEKIRLPDDFSPSAYSVLIGRGKVNTEATGNKRLKVIVSTFLDEYSKAPNRISRSIIVSKIVDMIHEACPVGSFVKHEDGAWWQVSDHMARERVGSMLRDALHEQYKSSSRSKLARRRNSIGSDGLDDNSDAPAYASDSKKSAKKPPPAHVTSMSSTASTTTSSGDEVDQTQKHSDALASGPYIKQMPARYTKAPPMAGGIRLSDSHSSTIGQGQMDNYALSRIETADVFSRKLSAQSRTIDPFTKGNHDGKYEWLPKGDSETSGIEKMHSVDSWPVASPPDDLFMQYSNQQLMLQMQLQQQRQQLQIRQQNPPSSGSLEAQRLTSSYIATEEPSDAALRTNMFDPFPESLVYTPGTQQMSDAMLNQTRSDGVADSSLKPPKKETHSNESEGPGSKD